MSVDVSTDTGGVVWINAVQVRERYGNRPDMWLWRRKQEADFPKPIVIAGRNYWRLADLIAWEEAHATAS